MKKQKHEEKHKEKNKGTKRNVTGTLRTPAICATNFGADNLDPVEFTGIPAIGVRITQKSTTDTYPFTPVTGTENGLSYTDVATSGQVTVSVTQTSTTTYYYKVNCNCPGDEGNHSVTVNT
jgi:hypothetical protein